VMGSEAVCQVTGERGNGREVGVRYCSGLVAFIMVFKVSALVFGGVSDGPLVVDFVVECHSLRVDMPCPIPMFVSEVSVP